MVDLETIGNGSAKHNGNNMSPDNLEMEGAGEDDNFTKMFNVLVEVHRRSEFHFQDGISPHVMQHAHQMNFNQIETLVDELLDSLTKGK